MEYKPSSCKLHRTGKQAVVVFIIETAVLPWYRRFVNMIQLRLSDIAYLHSRPATGPKKTQQIIAPRLLRSLGIPHSIKAKAADVIRHIDLSAMPRGPVFSIASSLISYHPMRLPSYWWRTTSTACIGSCWFFIKVNLGRDTRIYMKEPTTCTDWRHRNATSLLFSWLSVL